MGPPKRGQGSDQKCFLNIIASRYTTNKWIWDLVEKKKMGPHGAP
jgi:hypothetical protein